MAGAGVLGGVTDCASGLPGALEPGLDVLIVASAAQHDLALVGEAAHVSPG